VKDQLFEISSKN
jgi:hypothetical protein